MEIVRMTVPSAASYEDPAQTTTIPPQWRARGIKHWELRRHSNDLVAVGASRVVTKTAHSATNDDKTVTPT